MTTNLREELKAKKQAYVQDEIISAAARLFAERGIRAVTIEDARRVARRLFAAPGFLTVIVGEPQGIADSGG